MRLFIQCPGRREGVVLTEHFTPEQWAQYEAEKTELERRCQLQELYTRYPDAAKRRAPEASDG